MRVLLLLASLVLGVLAQVKQVDDSALHELVKEHPEISVLVAFTAPWCGHCKRLKPVWEKLDNKFADDDAVVVAEINAVENSYAAAQYGVRGFPTIKLVRNHEMLSFEGKRDVTTLAEFALAAHANKDWEPVPEPLTTTGLFLVEAKRMFGDVLVLIQTRVHVAIVLFAFGTVFGFMFGLVVAGSDRGPTEEELRRLIREEHGSKTPAAAAPVQDDTSERSIGDRALKQTKKNADKKNKKNTKPAKRSTKKND
ncbi:MAG: hypothetical protein MHM6MM_007571 [Cercozoa sp. M6MM]